MQIQSRFMTTHSITIDLPEPVYRQLAQLARETNRSVNDLLLDTLSTMATEADDLPPQARLSMVRMTLMSDDDLFRAAKTTLLPEQHQRLEELHLKAQSEGLSAEERQEEQALLALYHDTMLIRAQAAVLLAQRGYDVSDPAKLLG
jgi:hypothetical protein